MISIDYFYNQIYWIRENFYGCKYGTGTENYGEPEKKTVQTIFCREKITIAWAIYGEKDMIEFVKIVEEYFSFGVKADKMVKINERLKDIEKDFKWDKI